MCEVERQQVPAVRGEREGAGQAILESRAEICPVEAERSEPLVRYQVEDPDFAVVALRNIDGAIVQGNGRAQKDAFRIGIRGLETGWNLRDLRLLAIEPGEDRDRKRLRATVDRDQRFAVGAKRQAVRVRRDLDLLAKRCDQPPVGQNSFALGVDLDGAIARRRLELGGRRRNTASSQRRRRNQSQADHGDEC